MSPDVAHSMIDQQARAFLSKGTRTGKLATVRADGSPHVVPLWFILDGEDLVFATGAGTAKGRALLRDPRAALVVDLEEPPFGFVLVEGTVSITSNLEEVLPLAVRIARRYVGDDEAEDVGARNAVEGELLVRLHPVKVTSFAGMLG